jgi:hypothetical protein
MKGKNMPGMTLIIYKDGRFEKFWKRSGYGRVTFEDILNDYNLDPAIIDSFAFYVDIL